MEEFRFGMSQLPDCLLRSDFFFRYDGNMTLRAVVPRFRAAVLPAALFGAVVLIVVLGAQVRSLREQVRAMAGVPRKYLRLYRMQGVPSTLVVDADGNVLYGRPGVLTPLAEDSVVMFARAEP